MTVKLYLKHPKNSTGNLRQDEVSIIAKITKDRMNRFEISTDEKIIPKYWDSRAQCVKASAHDHISINLYLQEFKRNLITTYRENREKQFSEYKELVRGRIQKKTVEEAFTAFIKAHREEELAEKTVQAYERLKKQVSKYSFDDFNAGFPFRFRPELKDYTDTSFYCSLKNLKAVLGWAKDKGFPTRPEFERWQIKSLSSSPLSFSKEELSALESAQLPKNLAIARDYFVISCRTSLRISDVKRLSIADLDGDTITLTPKKGSKLSITGGKRQTLYFTSDSWSAPALDILLRHGGKLPKVSENTLNINLRTAADKAEVHGIIKTGYWKDGQYLSEDARKCDVVTLHWGKKTFITLALDSGMPLAKVSEMSATSVPTIMKHYAAKGDKKVNENYLKQMVRTA